MTASTKRRSSGVVVAAGDGSKPAEDMQKAERNEVSTAFLHDVGTRLDLYRQSHTDEVARSGLNTGVERANYRKKLVQKWALDTVDLGFCPDAWAVRQKLINKETGEMLPMVCGKYSCIYCGPRMVELWRSVIRMGLDENERYRFVTLSKCSKTLEGVGRVATTLVQNMRRQGFTFEYLMTIEKHKNGWFHIHMIQRGTYLPKALLKKALYSATHETAYIVKIEQCKGDVAGYVTKYITKALDAEDYGRNENGTRKRVNRIRYSKHMFTRTTKEIRAQIKELARQKALEDGKDISNYDRSFQLVEVHQLPTDENGNINHKAALLQHERLVEKMRNSEDNHPSTSRALGVTLQYMYKAYIERELNIYDTQKHVLNESLPLRN